MDILQEHLVRARSSGGVFAKAAVLPPWGIALPGSIQLIVHMVLTGRAYVWNDDYSNAYELVPGNLALVPGGRDHHLAHSPGALCISHEEFLSNHSNELSSNQDASVFMCGAYQFSGDIGSGLLKTLPPILVLQTTPDEPLRQIITLVSNELNQPSAGHQTALDRLLDLLIVYALRASLEQNPTPPAWFRAANDSRLGAALQAIHSKPENPWTVPELASLSRMSRAAFARNFEQALGEPPMHYLTTWRMTLARDLLQAGELSITEIAMRVGYSSTNAFSAAFFRHHKQRPGEWRLAFNPPLK
jgi:AraC-like DNA-binding protein